MSLGLLQRGVDRLLRFTSPFLDGLRPSDPECPSASTTKDRAYGRCLSLAGNTGDTLRRTGVGKLLAWQCIRKPTAGARASFAWS